MEHLGSVPWGKKGEGVSLVSPARCDTRGARGKVRQRARSNSGVQPGARLNAVALYALGQSVQTVVFEFVMQFM